MLIAFFTAVLGVYLFCLFLIILYIARLNPGDSSGRSAYYPKVSILVAARNEEKNILRTLESLGQLSYPQSHLQILIGNDNSSDNTGDLVEKFIRDKPHFRLIEINTTLGRARMKANVLAHLARGASGEFYFFTDADCVVPPEWIGTMLSGFSESVGLVSGGTVVRGKRLFDKIQGLDWLLLCILGKFFNDLRPLTGFGNNMVIRAKVYWQTGGYENLNFSLVEDYRLTQEILARGWRIKHLFVPTAINFSAPCPDMRTYIDQKRRWVIEKKSFPALLLAMLVSEFLFFPSVLALAYFQPTLGLAAFALQALLKFSLILVGIKKIQYFIPIKNIFLYSLCHSPAIFLIGLVTWFTQDTQWKGRRYQTSARSSTP